MESWEVPESEDTMKVKLFQIYNSVPSIRKINNGDVTSIVRHKMRKNSEALQKELSLIQEEEKRLQKECTNSDRDGEEAYFDQNRFRKSMNEYLMNEVEVDIQFLTLEDLSSVVMSLNDEKAMIRVELTSEGSDNTGENYKSIVETEKHGCFGVGLGSDERNYSSDANLRTLFEEFEGVLVSLGYSKEGIDNYYKGV